MPGELIAALTAYLLVLVSVIVGETVALMHIIYEVETRPPTRLRPRA